MHSQAAGRPGLPGCLPHPPCPAADALQRMHCQAAEEEGLPSAALALETERAPGGVSRGVCLRRRLVVAPVAQLVFQQERREGDLRFAHLRLRWAARELHLTGSRELPSRSVGSQGPSLASRRQAQPPEAAGLCTAVSART